MAKKKKKVVIDESDILTEDYENENDYFDEDYEQDEDEIKELNFDVPCFDRDY